jgi:hypothetical protein
MLQPPPLDYAPNPAWHSHWLTRVASAVAMAIVLALGYRYAPIAWRNAKLFYWQQRCMTNAVPKNEIVLDAASNSVKADNKDPFQTFYRIYSPPGSTAYVTVFAHGRQSHSGKRRLVVVEAFDDYIGAGVFLGARSFDPGSLMSSPIEIVRPNWAPHAYVAPIFAGQIDSADASHFTIQCGSGILVDGWLRDDGSVTLEPRQSFAQ